MSINASDAMIWRFFPNWEVQPSLTYNFKTNIYKTPRFFEQRTPFSFYPVRTVKTSFTVGETNNESQLIFNFLQEAHDKIIVFPIFSEVLYPSTTIYNKTAISLSTSLEFHYNIRRYPFLYSGYIFCIDTKNKYYEIKKIGTSSFSSPYKSLTVVGVFTRNYDYTKTMFFPVVFGIVNKINLVHITDIIDDLEVEVTEYPGEVV